MTGFYFVEIPIARTRQVAITLGSWMILAAGAAILFFFNPSLPSNQFFPKCPFYWVTGLQCPGCGATRALYHLLHLHPITAFKFNPLFVLTLPFIIYGFLGFTVNAIAARPYRRLFVPPFYLWAWLVLIIFFWIFRNTPWYPFPL